MVAVLGFDGVVLGDLTLPCELFARASFPDGSAAYDVRVCATKATVRSRHVDLGVPHRLRTLGRADTIVVPGPDVGEPLPAEVVRALRRLLARPKRQRPRIMSICTGAFVLAAAGALDGRRATTHWLACPRLAQAFPNVEVDPEVLYVDHGDLLTSAGATAGLDLCLHVIRKDLGAAESARVARMSVAPLERSGGQAQFIEHAPPATEGTSLAALGAWIEAHLDAKLTLPALARRAGLSTRSLSRHCKAQLGLSPAQWVAQARVRRAQELLEQTDLSVERIAEAVGFGSPSVLRERFTKAVKLPPSRWRQQFAAPR